MTKFKVGDRVRFIDEDAHLRFPRYYPAVGTIGIVYEAEDEGYYVEWPDGTTSYDDYWFAAEPCLELAE